MKKVASHRSPTKRVVAALNPNDYESPELELQALATIYANVLKVQIDKRTAAMDDDDDAHRLIYRVLGVPDDEGHLIDIYQNKGRFLYKYAGAFLEDAAKVCLRRAFPKAIMPSHLPNTISAKPAEIEIDCLVGNDAMEIKWRDATTDGDHITKEHTRVKVIKDAGLVPIRIMFYRPNRDQAIQIQARLERLYSSVDGEYYSGPAAWGYIEKRTGVNLELALQKVGKKQMKNLKAQMHVI